MIALGPNMARGLFSCVLQAGNRFYILKLLEEKVKEWYFVTLENEIDFSAHIETGVMIMLACL